MSLSSGLGHLCKLYTAEHPLVPHKFIQVCFMRLCKMWSLSKKKYNDSFFKEESFNFRVVLNL